MNEIHRAIRERCAGALAARCRKGNCRLHTYDISRDKLTIVDVDRYLPDSPEGIRKPDFYVFVTNEATYLVVVEMKDGKGRASDAAQIQAGADQVDQLLSDFHRMGFLPLLVHQSINSIERRALGRRKVRFRGTRYSVVTCRCGTCLWAQL